MTLARSTYASLDADAIKARLPLAGKFLCKGFTQVMKMFDKLLVLAGSGRMSALAYRQAVIQADGGLDFNPEAVLRLGYLLDPAVRDVLWDLASFGASLMQVSNIVPLPLEEVQPYEGAKSSTIEMLVGTLKDVSKGRAMVFSQESNLVLDQHKACVRSPLGAVDKKDDEGVVTGKRQTINMRYVNEELKRQQVVAWSKLGRWMPGIPNVLGKCDLSDAFKFGTHMAIPDVMSQACVMPTEGVEEELEGLTPTFIATTLVFGYTGSPASFGVLAHSLVGMLNNSRPAEPRLNGSMNFSGLPFVDDLAQLMCRLGSRPALSLEVYHYLVEQVAGPGAVNQVKDAQFGLPMETMDVWGHVMNLKENTLGVREAKLVKQAEKNVGSTVF